MTFSLRPSSLSTLPESAASVSTLVVSWKEAAARKLSVFSDALVTPSSTGCAVAGSPPSARTWRFLSSNSKRSTSSPGSRSVSPGCVDPQLAQHLPHDDLDVLVVDGHTLRAVHLLDLVHQVPLHGLAALDAQDLLRVLGALGELVARRDRLAVLDPDPRRGRHAVLALLALLGHDHDLGRLT